MCGAFFLPEQGAVDRQLRRNAQQRFIVDTWPVQQSRWAEEMR